MEINNIKQESIFENENKIKFEIGDSEFITDLLISKIYSDPIESITREILCNARDANREKGEKDVILVDVIEDFILPREKFFDKAISFQDFGIGISKERMLEIFRFFGKSTKRNNNIQTGGFGLGAKSPLAYTSIFYIQTISFENEKYVERLWSIERNNICILNEEESKNKATSTKVIIPIKKEDLVVFVGKINFISQFMKEPIFFKGVKLEKIKPCYEDNDILVCLENKIQGKSIIIDGIAYSSNNENFFYNNIIYKFKLGELSLSPNRETIHWDEETKNKFHLKVKSTNVYLERMFETFSKDADANIESFLKVLFYLKSELSKDRTFEKNIINKYLKLDSNVLERSIIKRISIYSFKEEFQEIKEYRNFSLDYLLKEFSKQFYKNPNFCIVYSDRFEKVKLKSLLKDKKYDYICYLKKDKQNNETNDLLVSILKQRKVDIIDDKILSSVKNIKTRKQNSTDEKVYKINFKSCEKKIIIKKLNSENLYRENNLFLISISNKDFKNLNFTKYVALNHYLNTIRYIDSNLIYFIINDNDINEYFNKHIKYVYNEKEIYAAMENYFLQLSIRKSYSSFKNYIIENGIKTKIREIFENIRFDSYLLEINDLKNEIANRNYKENLDLRNLLSKFLKLEFFIKKHELLLVLFDNRYRLSDKKRIWIEEKMKKINKTMEKFIV